MHTDRIPFLLQRYLDNNISPAEMEELGRILHRGDHGEEFHQALEDIIENGASLPEYRDADWDPLLSRIMERKGGVSSQGRVTRLKRALAAAAILAVLAGGAWLLLAKGGRNKELAASARREPVMAQDIAPGGNRATLTLSDNSTIDLDEAKAGVVGQQGNVQIVKRRDGQLAYQPAGHRPRSGTMNYNLLTTPRGGQYQLVLPDGSKVWLNAASSLRYPTGFTGKERVVELKGEAYFEIAKNASMPFRVSVSSGNGGEPVDVHVLGTHFNIKAYADEPSINTTLLEGSVKVQKGASSVLVKPGERADCKGQGAIELSDADIEEAVAWKNGLFKFDEATIEEVMRQLSRWYDVEVVYAGGAPKDLFRGEIYRNVNVSKVLKVLEASGVRFTVEGKKILVK